MTNKKLKTKMANALRRALGCTWDESHKLARYVCKYWDVDLNSTDVLVDCAVNVDYQNDLNVVSKYLDTANNYLDGSHYTNVYRCNNGHVYKVDYTY